MEFSPDLLLALVTLTFLEIILGFDNLVFISIVADELPPEKRKLARNIGLSLALVVRIGLLLLLTEVDALDHELFRIHETELSIKAVIMILGGIYLIARTVIELKAKVRGHEKKLNTSPGSFLMVIVEIVVIDAIFSIDSVLTAIGMTSVLWVMVVAMSISILFMIILGESVHRFLMGRPTLQVLALSFMIMVGVLLIAEGMGESIPKGYLYVAITFSLGVELLNHQVVKKRNKEA